MLENIYFFEELLQSLEFFAVYRKFNFTTHIILGSANFVEDCGSGYLLVNKNYVYLTTSDGFYVRNIKNF